VPEDVRDYCITITENPAPQETLKLSEPSKAKPQLRSLRPAEGSSGKPQPSFINSRLAASHVKQRLDLIGKYPLAPHPRPKLRLIQFPIAQSANPVQHFLLLIWKMVPQPLFE
jgi:hypothetical protein